MAERPHIEADIEQRRQKLDQALQGLKSFSAQIARAETPLTQQVLTEVELFFQAVVSESILLPLAQIDQERVKEALKTALDLPNLTLEWVSLSSPPPKPSKDAGPYADIVAATIGHNFQWLIQERFYDTFADLIGDDELNDLFTYLKPLDHALKEMLGEKLQQGDGLYRAPPDSFSAVAAGDRLASFLKGYTDVIQMAVGFAAHGRHAEVDALLPVLRMLRTCIPMGNVKGVQERLLVLVA